MQIDFNQLSIDKIFMLSKHIKEKCKNLSSFDEVAQELMRILYSSFVAGGGRSPFVLARFFKSCAYGELPDDIRNYIQNKESKGNLISNNKYLTLLGSYGELDNWKNRNLSENYKAFPIHDEHMLDKFPMLSATFEEIGLKLSLLKQTDKSILIKDDHRQYGVFCVEDAEGSKLIPKQAEFVRPYSVKSVFGFGGIYSTSNVYAVLIFSRERLNRKDAQLFLSLNPAIKQITLAHEITGNIFKTDRKDTNSSVDSLCDKIPTVQIKPHDKTVSRQHKDIIETEMALTSSIELEMANEYLLQMSEALKKKNKKLVKGIEDRKQAEDALRRSEKSLAEAQHISRLGNWDWNIVDNELYCSDEIYRIFGLKPHEFGATYDAFLNSVHPDDKEFVKNSVNKALYEKQPYRIDHRIVLPNGTVRIVHEEAAMTYDGEGKPIRMIGIIQDITEIKKMEEALLQSEKLRSIGTITAGISHEFNNLLAIISGNVQLLEETYKDHGDLMDALLTIKKAADDGAEISSKMLKFTKTKQDAKKFVSNDIRDLIMQSIDFTKPRWKNEAQSRGINYQIDKEGMKSVSPIMCNPTEVREVFINIINNALDAMPEGGSISFSAWRGDDTVFVSISDTGDGMSEDVKKNIFDPFFTTKLVVGTGLGMSVAYGIITRHGGKIEVKSELGKGTTFTLQFPATNKRASLMATPEPEQEIKNKRLRILVIDDEEAICNILDTFLSRGGHKVKTVDNGTDAINIIKTENFDLVLCDMAMPDVFGYDVVKVLNELEKRPKIGIITGWGEKLTAIDGEVMKVDFISKKPFKFSELTKQINNVIGV